MTTLDLLEHLEQAVAFQSKRLAPDDDFMPVLHLWEPKEGLTIAALVVESNEELLALIPQAERDHNAVIAGLITTNWEILIMEGEPFLGISPKMDPDRRECVSITVAGPDGVISTSAPITRVPNAHPKLGKWERCLQQGDTFGRGATALLAGLAV